MTTNAPSAATNTANTGEGLRAPVEPWNIVPIWEWVIGIALVALILGLAALAFILWWRARKRRLQQVPEPPLPLPAHVRARHQLEAALRFLSDPDRFCTEVSWILRRYLEDRFGWNAPDRTTEEFLHELGSEGELSESQRILLTDFLTRCDMVKFARHDPTEPELLELHRAALRLVADTVPTGLPPGPVPGAPSSVPVSS